MPLSLESGHVRSEEFNPNIVTEPRPTHHYVYLNDKNGDSLGTTAGASFHVQGHVDDSVSGTYLIKVLSTSFLAVCCKQQT